MVLRILEVFFTSYFPTQYAVHIAVGILTIYVLRTFAQGRKTNRERDLHARVVLVTVSQGSLIISHFSNNLKPVGWLYTSWLDYSSVSCTTWCPYNCTHRATSRVAWSRYSDRHFALDDVKWANLRWGMWSDIANLYPLLLYEVPDWQRPENRFNHLRSRTQTPWVSVSSFNDRDFRGPENKRFKFISDIPYHYSPPAILARCPSRTRYPNHPRCKPVLRSRSRGTIFTFLRLRVGCFKG